ncbi:hypothetical protein EVAR_24722_1 [Eumeta japonica]|uniref:Uncharacterized protein n=1 Tax=Eumeta variegata TaxID=151549 RepID=A0A4C1VDP9_EUMVA|nr:hypothetical protein EVAR_24722_1 [Eumeta japonica]
MAHKSVATNLRRHLIDSRSGKTSPDSHTNSENEACPSPNESHFREGFSLTIIQALLENYLASTYNFSKLRRAQNDLSRVQGPYVHMPLDLNITEHIEVSTRLFSNSAGAARH